MKITCLVPNTQTKLEKNNQSKTLTGQPEVGPMLCMHAMSSTLLVRHGFSKPYTVYLLPYTQTLHMYECMIL